MCFMVETFLLCLCIVYVEVSFMKKIFILFIPLLTLFACNNDEPDGPVIHEKVDRTVLVYMAANNSLGDWGNNNYDEKDIAEMLEGMKNTDNVGNLILYTVNQREKKPYLIDIKKTDKGAVLDTIVRYESRNSLSVDNMKEVFDYVFKIYPADSYGLCLWSHADGWFEDYDMVSTRYIGQDGNNYLSIPDLVSVLKEAPHFDFIFFDACFMQAATVAYELRSYTDYIIGSTTEIPGTGAPYQLVIEPMFKTPCDAYGIAANYYNHYASNYKPNYNLSYYEGEWPYGACVSAIKCSEMEGLATETEKILKNHINDIINLQRGSIQYYDRRSRRAYYDMKDFINHIATDAEKVSWMEQLNKTMLYDASTQTCYSAFARGTFSIERHSGIATYIPVFHNSSYTKWNTYYKTFQWYTAAGWDKVFEVGEE